jgi:23S rRNA (adenine2503-C2)-methyltransferase
MIKIANDKKDIRDLSFEEAEEYFTSIGEKPFRAVQTFEWIYKKNAVSFEEMANIPKPLRDRLSQDFNFAPQVVAAKDVSTDGTTKFLFDLKDHQKVETVLIPTENRATACISTQAGCKFGCRFCASGIAGWTRNLSPSEIVAQVIHAKREAKERPLSHIVFMGIGEPLDNYDNVLKAIHLINSDKAINIGARRITVSTCGVVPRIKMLAQQDLQIELAISLHGYDNESRNVLMPVNKKYPIEELIEACREYVGNKKRQITFEYILIKDVTCTPKAVETLRKLFKGLICKMNLIPYNPVSEFGHKCPSRAEMFEFRDLLERSGIHATIRTPRGRDVAAACGQLRHEHREEGQKTGQTIA